MRCALIQLSSTKEIDHNLQVCRDLAEEARQTGARWILFPENAPFLGRDRDKIPIAENLDGPMVGAYRQMARDLDAWITVGSFPEKSPDPQRTYNTQVQINPDGSIAAVYRKIHLFDVALNEAVNFMESHSVFPGREVATAEIEEEGRVHKVGLTICYDLRFPELYRALQKRGVQVLTVPSAFTLSTGHAHWHALIRARAIENQCYVLAPNQWGHHYGNRHSFGQSTIYDPWGRCVACASDRVGFVIAELDFDYLSEIRRAMPVLSHRCISELDGAIPVAVDEDRSSSD